MVKEYPKNLLVDSCMGYNHVGIAPNRAIDRGSRSVYAEEAVACRAMPWSAARFVTLRATFKR